MKVGIIPGAFKPPHKGHFLAAQKAADENDMVYILISSKERDGITGKQSYDVWDTYRNELTNIIPIICKVTPVRDTYEMIEEWNADSNYHHYQISLYADKEDQDRFKSISKYSGNLKSVILKESERVLSGTLVREHLSQGIIENLQNDFPPQFNLNNILKLLNVTCTISA